MFIVEFIGNGICSRAVIKKGALSFIEIPTLAGHFINILNEDMQICKAKHTGIWLDKRFYEASD